MRNVLEVRNLHVNFISRAGTSVSAITDVSFDLGPGEILGVLGESGSGKSTLAASLLRLLPRNGRIRSGSVRLQGREILEASPGELERIRGKQIALTNQEPSLALHPTMRVRDQVGEVLAAHESLSRGARRERTRRVLAALFPSESERISSSYPHELSGGQRQRVLIAQAIACGPSVLVADEPTASLDASTQREILSTFLNLRRKLGLAILLITHNPFLLEGLADRVLVLYAGRIAEIGPAESVLSKSKHPYTQALLRCAPSFARRDGEFPRKSKLPVIPGDSPDLAAVPEGCWFEPRCADRWEICRKREPATVPPGAGHLISCFKFGG